MKKTKKSNPHPKRKAKRSAGTKPKQKLLFSTDQQLTREQAQDARNRALLGVLAPIVIGGHAREDVRVQRINEQYEHEAMVGEVVWHVHKRK
jgi:hypothetical protein